MPGTVRLPMAKDQPSTAAPVDRRATVMAWLVHGFTATGATLAFLALIAIWQERWLLALAWLLLALVIDGLDGSLARWAQVKQRAPRIDGDSLDLIVDYLTYVFVPTIFIWRAGLVPAGLAVPLAAAIQFSSLYLFARTDMKTDDGYFRGFPALWNLVAFYLFVLQPGPRVGAVAVVLLAAATFAPIHFVHPFRVRGHAIWLPLLAGLWAVSTGALLWDDWPGLARTAALWLSVGSASALLLLGLRRSLARPIKHAP